MKNNFHKDCSLKNEMNLEQKNNKALFKDKCEKLYINNKNLVLAKKCRKLKKKKKTNVRGKLGKCTAVVEFSDQHNTAKHHTQVSGMNTTNRDESH